MSCNHKICINQVTLVQATNQAKKVKNFSVYLFGDLDDGNFFVFFFLIH